LEGVDCSLERLKSERAENTANPAEIDRILAFGKKLMHEIRVHNDNFAESEFEHGHLRKSPTFSSGSMPNQSESSRRRRVMSRC
jgi:hypothetical protein